MGEIRVADAALDLEDRTLSPAVQLNLAPMAFTVAGLSGEPGTKINVTADVGLGGNPLLKSSGELQLTPLTAALALDLNAFDLSILQPYVAQATNLTLRSGRLSVKGDLSAAAEEGAAPTLQFKGDVQVADLHTIAGPANEDLVKWRNLAVTGIDLSHNPGPPHDRAHRRATALRARDHPTGSNAERHGSAQTRLQRHAGT